MLLVISTLVLAPLVGLIVLLWSEGVGVLFRKRMKYPPSFPPFFGPIFTFHSERIRVTQERM